MSLFVTNAGRETPFKFVLPTSAQVLVTAGQNGCIVVVVRIAEVAAATPNITLDILDADGVTVHKIAQARVFTAKEIWKAVVLADDPIVLLPGEKLRATASVADQLHATGVFIEPANS